MSISEAEYKQQVADEFERKERQRLGVSHEPDPSRAFNGRHRQARVAKFNGALKRKKATRKQQRKLKQASQRRNRA